MLRHALGLLILLLSCAQALAQLPIYVPNVARTEGVETTSGIHYVRFFLGGHTNSASPEPTAALAPASGQTQTQTLDLSQPILTAQCSRNRAGKYLFELFVNFGGVTDTDFYPPWRPANSDDLFPPPTRKAALLMEFLGYTKFKPVKRQFEYVLQPDHQLRYNPPSSRSTNLEEIAYYLHVLRALPTLRISDAQHSASFLTTPLLAQLHSEPLCAASGL